MKSRALLFTLCCSLAVPAIHAADDHPPRHHEEQTELGEHMEKMGRAFRALNREINDPARHEDALKQVAILRTNAEAAAKLQPAKTADIAPADRDAFVADFREKMKQLLADIDSLQAALKDGHNPEAVALVKKLKQEMDDGHKKFRKKKDMM